MTALITILGTCLCAALYRFGGAAKKGDKWDWLRFSKARDIGCSLVIVGMMYLLGFHVAWYWIGLAFVGMWASLSTYWDDIFGYDNFYAHGLAIALCIIAYAFPLGGHLWYTIPIRAVIVSVFMGVWCDRFSNDIVEEVGRGAIIAATIPILML